MAKVWSQISQDSWK